MPISPDTMLGIQVGSVMSRNRYTTDPASVVAELRATAGDRTDILAAEVGGWVGFYGDAEEVSVLVSALLAMTDLDLEPGIAVGRERRGAGVHGTSGFTPRNQETPPPAS